MSLSRPSSILIGVWVAGMSTLAIPGVVPCTGSLVRDLTLSAGSLGVVLATSRLMRHQSSPAREATASVRRDGPVSPSHATSTRGESIGSRVGQPA